MLDKEKFLAMKDLARSIRKNNKEKFESLEKEPLNDAIRDKDEFIESIIKDMDINFEPGEEGKEERQIFRANLLIPDDITFFQEYSKDKNVRNLMNKYAVGIEDVMSKITELNLYSNYIDTFSDEPEEKEEVVDKPAVEEKNDFVDNMVDLSAKEAENLLDEIEDLSTDMETLDIKQNDEPEENNFSLEPEVVNEKEEFQEVPEIFDNKENEIEEAPKGEYKPAAEDMITPIYDIPEEDVKDVVDIDIEEEAPIADIEISDEIENISSAVSEFVDEYSKVKRELEFTQAKVEKFNSEKEELRKKLNISKDENEALEKQNDSLREEIEKFYNEAKKLNEEKDELKKQISDHKQEIKELEEQKQNTKDQLDKVMYEAEKLASENDTLNEKIKSMEKTVKQSTDLLKEIYKSIPKKRFNVK